MLDGSAIDNSNECALRHNIPLFFPHIIFLLAAILKSYFGFSEKFTKMCLLFFAARIRQKDLKNSGRKRANQLITLDGFCVRFLRLVHHKYEAQIYSNEIISVRWV